MHRRGLQNVRFGFFAESFQVAQLAFAGEFFHALNGRDFKLFEQDRDFLRAHALQMEQIEQRERVLLQ